VLRSSRSTRPRPSGTARPAPRPRARALRLGAALALGGLLACEHPIAGAHASTSRRPDLEVRDAGGVLVARTRDNRAWEGGPLVLADGRARTLRVTALDFQGAPIRLSGRAGVDVRAEAEPAAALVWEPRDGRGAP
jgi:hypothetical protein